jgi:4,5-dihydroxyphthalate decarboxylase
MSMPTIHLGVRHWDHVLPIVVGDVRSDAFDIQLHRLPKTPDLRQRADLDGGETSLSRITLDQQLGRDDLVPIPAFVLSAFRQRCILVNRSSEKVRLDQLQGARVGLTGWPDTGNTWTRALLRAAGVRMGEVQWVVGGLTPEPEPAVRIGPYGCPANVSTVRPEDSIVGLLVDGELDAIMTPTMPAGFHAIASPLRPLLADYRAHEVGYFRDKGFVPAIHTITLRRSVLERFPDSGAEVLDLFRRSHRLWMDRRIELVDTTPWLIDEVQAMSESVGLDWSPYEPPYLGPMLSELCDELFQQGVTDRHPEPDEVFRDYFSTGRG